MKIFLKSKKSGYTLVEIMAVSSIATFVLICTTAMWMATAKSFNNTIARNNAASDAIYSMQRIVDDVREATGASTYITSGKKVLRVVMPIEVAESGYYDKSKSSPYYKDYYRSDETKAINKSGSCLCVYDSKTNTTRILHRGIQSLDFALVDESTVKVTVTTSCDAADGKKKTCTLTQRVIYMRNS